jgi:ABC-type branched-subunit amino acid transport system permease subunit
VGAGIILFIQDIIGAKTEYWELCIGIVMLAIVILLPRGVVGTFQGLHFRPPEKDA